MFGYLVVGGMEWYEMEWSGVGWNWTKWEEGFYSIVWKLRWKWMNSKNNNSFIAFFPIWGKKKWGILENRIIIKLHMIFVLILERDICTGVWIGEEVQIWWYIKRMRGKCWRWPNFLALKCSRVFILLYLIFKDLGVSFIPVSIFCYSSVSASEPSEDG